MTGSHLSCETQSTPQYLKTWRVKGTSPDNCNQSLMAWNWERPSGFVGFASLNETVDQSSGVDRASRRHPQQTDPRRNGVGNCFNSSYNGTPMPERKKIREEISGGNLRIKGSCRVFYHV